MFDEGDKVVVLLTCAGITTASIQTVSKIKGNVVHLEDVTTQTFSRNTGMPLQPEIISGMSRRLVVLEQ